MDTEAIRYRQKAFYGLSQKWQMSHRNGI